MDYVVLNGTVTDKVTDATFLFCGHLPSKHAKITNGFGIDKDDRTHCYDCCAASARQNMIETGKQMLYLTKDENKFVVTDWAGHLRFGVSNSQLSRHNIARTRTDVWFIGPDKHWWWGVSYGRHTQIVHCKRTKKALKAHAA